MIKPKKTIELQTVLLAFMICGYGMAIGCALSLLSLGASPEYFEFDSKSASIPVKFAIISNPKLVVLFLLVGVAVGVSAQLINKYRKNA